jgi:hypothetical protein
MGASKGITSKGDAMKQLIGLFSGRISESPKLSQNFNFNFICFNGKIELQINESKSVYDYYSKTIDDVVVHIEGKALKSFLFVINNNPNCAIYFEPEYFDNKDAIVLCYNRKNATGIFKIPCTKATTMPECEKPTIENDDNNNTQKNNDYINSKLVDFVVTKDAIDTIILSSGRNREPLNFTIFDDRIKLESSEFCKSEILYTKAQDFKIKRFSIQSKWLNKKEFKKLADKKGNIEVRFYDKHITFDEISLPIEIEKHNVAVKENGKVILKPAFECLDNIIGDKYEIETYLETNEATEDIKEAVLLLFDIEDVSKTLETYNKRNNNEYETVEAYKKRKRNNDEYDNRKITAFTRIANILETLKDAEAVEFYNFNNS